MPIARLECGHVVPLPSSFKPGDDYPCPYCGEKATTAAQRLMESETGRVDGMFGAGGMSAGGVFGGGVVSFDGFDQDAKFRAGSHAANQATATALPQLAESMRQMQELMLAQQREIALLSAERRALIEARPARKSTPLLAAARRAQLELEEDEEDLEVDEDEDIEEDEEEEEAPAPKKKKAKAKAKKAKTSKKKAKAKK